MWTYVYTRPNLVSAGFDRYNALVDSPFQSTPSEYWTNGFTTHLMAAAATAEFSGGQASTGAGTTLISRTMTATTQSAMPRPTATTTTSSGNGGVVRHSIMAGSIAGMSSTLMLYPMEVLRTKMQQGAGGATADALKVMRLTFAHGGFRALYTGLSLPLTAQAAYKSTVFTCYNASKQFLLDWRHSENRKTGMRHAVPTLSMLDRFWCGCIGGAINGFIFVTPVEFVRNQLIAQHSRMADGEKLGGLRRKGAWDVIRSAVRQYGVQTLWRGSGLTVVRDSVGCGLFFITNATTQKLLTPPGEHPSALVTMFAGALSGVAFWSWAYPFDCVKSWIQGAKDLSVQQRPTEALREILADTKTPYGAFKRLYHGFPVAFARSMPSAAITMSVFSLVYRHLTGTTQV